MRHFTVRFSKYTTFDDAAAPVGVRGIKVTSQPIDITEASFADAYRYAALRVSGMRDADPVNVYEIAAIHADGHVSGTTAIDCGDMFEIDSPV